MTARVVESCKYVGGGEGGVGNCGGGFQAGQFPSRRVEGRNKKGRGAQKELYNIDAIADHVCCVDLVALTP